MKHILQLIILSTLVFSSPEVSTKDDIKMLIHYMDKRFEASQHNIDKRFEETNNIMYGLVGLIGLIFALIIWDRRTMMEATLSQANKNVNQAIREPLLIQNK